jgi:hypothetical protein
VKKAVCRPAARHLFPNPYSELACKAMIGAEVVTLGLFIIQIRIKPMARSPHPQQTEALAWIRECVDQLGDPGYSVARAKFPHISQPTFWRWSQMVRAELMMAMASPSAHTDADTPAPASALTSASAPSADALGDLADSPMGFFEAHMNRMGRDIDTLRNSAEVRDQNGGARLRNPMMMVQATRLRHQMLTLYVQRQQAVVAAQKAGSYRELVMTAMASVLEGPARNEHEAAILRRLRHALGRAQEQWDAAQNILNPLRHEAVTAAASEAAKTMELSE